MVFCISLIDFAIIGIDAILYSYILKYGDTTFVISLFVWDLVMFSSRRSTMSPCLGYQTCLVMYQCVISTFGTPPQ